jgi:hypothetical protein
MHIATVKGVPKSIRGPLRAAFRISLEAFSSAYGTTGTDQQRIRAWKLFILTPRMLLHRGCAQVKLSKAAWNERFARFTRGEWAGLLTDAHQSGMGVRAPSTSATEAEAELRRVERAMGFVQMGELSAARQALVGSDLAPGDAETLAELRKRPQEQRYEIPEELLSSQPSSLLQLDRQIFVRNLKGARRGAAGSPLGTTAEHLQTILEDESCTELLCDVAERLARAHIPAEIAAAIRSGFMTALRKPNGKVRGIVVGDILRRLVARTIVQQFGEEINAACSPYQYALSTRAGTDCVSHAIRAATDADPSCTVGAIDGVGAFYFMSRSAMLAGWAELPGAKAALPFVRMSYGRHHTGGNNSAL